MQSLKQEEQRLVTRPTLLRVLTLVFSQFFNTALKFDHLSAVGVLTDAQCAELASKLAGYWRKLAPKLGLAEEKVGRCELFMMSNCFTGGSYGG